MISINKFRDDDLSTHEVLDINICMVDKLVSVVTYHDDKKFVHSLSLKLAVEIGLVDFTQLRKIIK